MAAPMALSVAQHRLLGVSRRYGSRAVVGAITGFSVVFSVVTTLACLALSPTPSEVVAPSLAIAAIVPMIVAPICSLLVVRLTSSLAEACDRLHTLATTDSLTGLANRRQFFDVATTILGETAPTELALVAMVDVDHFKALNDRHGHGMGDAALVVLARRLAEAVGERGVAARLGGDEFALVVPVGAREVPGIAGRIRAACGGIDPAPGVTLDASVGLCTVQGPTDPDVAVRLADAALYEAKGRRPTTVTVAAAS